MSLTHFFAVLRARWLSATVVFGAVVVAAVLYLVFATRIYTATASMLIDAKPDPVSTMLYGGAMPALINTQLEIIHSDRVAQRVVQNLKLADVADMRAAWAAAKSGLSLQEYLTEFIEVGLDPKVSAPGSNVINVAYKSPDPRFAATVANAYVQAYMETSIELRVDPARQYSGFFSDQQKEARTALETAQNKLSAFQREKGIIGSDDHFDLETSRLTALMQELVAIQTASVEASTRQGQIGNAGQLSEVLANGTVSGLKSELAQAELKLQDLSSRYGDRHPQVVDARVSHQREAEIQAAVDAQRAKVLQLKDTRDRVAVLQRDVDNAQHAYDNIFNRASQTNLESQNRQANATVISQATTPVLPSSPKVASVLVLGLAAALALGIGCALLQEQFDKRMRTTSDAFDFLGLPVIGIMPSPTMNRRLQGQMAMIQDRVVSGRRLPAPDKGQA